jgi:hypothetical protein
VVEAAFDSLRARGHTDKAIIDMCRRKPNIIRNGGERLAEHLDIFESAGLRIADRPDATAFSPKLLRGRIVFLESRGRTKQATIGAVACLTA